MKLIIALLAASTFALSACSTDPEQAAVRRTALIQQLFPNPADRQGIYLAFPIESGGFNSNVQIIYYNKAVSEAEISRRMTRYCTRYKSNYVSGQAYIRERGATKDITKPDGSTASATQIWYSCFKPKA